MSKNFELTQKVKFVRMTPEGEAVYGEGVVVAKLIGVSKRINYSVRDEGSLDHNGKPRAWNLEPEALDGTDEENAAYTAHHHRVTEVVKHYEGESQELVTKTNAEIDAMHAEFFGQQLDV